jgi:hypothetical protein
LFDSAACSRARISAKDAIIEIVLSRNCKLPIYALHTPY